MMHLLPLLLGTALAQEAELEAPADDAMPPDTTAAETLPDEELPDEEGLALQAPAEQAPLSDAYIPFVGVGLGFGLPEQPLGPGITPALSAGVEFPWLGRRLSTHIEAYRLASGTEGRVSSAGDNTRYETKHNLNTFGPHLRLRAMSARQSWSPTIGAGLQMSWIYTRSEATIDGQSGGVAEERVFRPGFLGTVGMDGEAGPGHLDVRAGIQTNSVRTPITGVGTSMAITLIASYRVYLGDRPEPVQQFDEPQFDDEEP